MRRLSGIRLFVSGLGITLFLLGLGHVGASSSNISHSYASTNGVTVGSIVSLDPTKPNYVVPSNTDNGEQLLGVAVNVDDSLLAVDGADATNAVQVATTGLTSLLVSTVNGSIKIGDQVSVSPFNGLGMKAEPGAFVIGLAQTAFDDKTIGAQTQAVTDRNGNKSQIKVGFVRLSIGVGAASAQQLGGNKLQRIAQSLTGHSVSATRVLISLIIAIVAIVALITLVYASIYGGIMAVGRNPLAKYSIFRSLASVLVMVLLIGLIAAGTIFFLLK